MNTNTTRDGVTVKPGQVWADCDPRVGDRRITVLSVQDGVAQVQSGPRRSRISIARMHEHSTGYRLIHDPNDSPS